MSSIHRAVLVTAADWNGRDFDGSPLTSVYPLKEGETLKDVVPWFFEAVKEKFIIMEARGQTDYCWFGIKDRDHRANVTWAGPGDMIVYDGLNGYLSVIPQFMAKHLERLCRSMQLSLVQGRQITQLASVAQMVGLLQPLPSFVN